jgi:hypothetical protein
MNRAMSGNARLIGGRARAEIVALAIEPAFRIGSALMGVVGTGFATEIDFRIYLRADRPGGGPSVGRSSSARPTRTNTYRRPRSAQRTADLRRGLSRAPRRTVSGRLHARSAGQGSSRRSSGLMERRRSTRPRSTETAGCIKDAKSMLSIRTP